MGLFDFLFSPPGKKAEFVLAYEAAFGNKIPASRGLGLLPFVILDTETTGLSPKSDYILSFGAVKLKGFQMSMEDAMECYLQTPRRSREAIEVHEILRPEELITLEDFAERFLSYIGSSIIVGHHVGFDLEMLTKALKPFGFRKFLNPVLDTHSLAVRLEKGPHYDSSMGKPGEYSLDSLCERYQICLDDRHTASGDAYLTAQLLMKLLKLAEKKGVGSYGELIR